MSRSDKTLAELAADISSAKRAKAGTDAHHHNADIGREGLSVEKLVDGISEGVPTVARAKVRAILERGCQREAERLTAVLKGVNCVLVWVDVVTHDGQILRGGAARRVAP